jgi:hypothetical protein
VDLIEVKWLSGQIDQFKDLAVNQLHVLQEGGKILSSAPLPQIQRASKPAAGAGV